MTLSDGLFHNQRADASCRSNNKYLQFHVTHLSPLPPLVLPGPACEGIFSIFSSFVVTRWRVEASSSSATDVCLQMLRITSALHLDILESRFYVLQIIRG